MLADVPVTATTSHPETLEEGLTGPVATGTPAGYLAKAGSLAKAHTASPTKEASAPAAAKEDPHTTATEAEHPTEHIK